jgi:WD40 repeat protein
MTARSATWLAWPVLLLPLAAVCRPEPGDQEIPRLVRQLGDDDFARREAATARLTEIGEPALEALARAQSSDDAEVRRRATGVVARIETKLYAEQRRLTGHTDERVFSVSVSGDGKRVLTASADGTLRLWDADTGKRLRVFRGHTCHVNGGALSPDGKRVLSGSHDDTVRLWDADTGKELLKMTGHDSLVMSVAFGPDGKALSGDFDGKILLWDLGTGKKVGELVGHTQTVASIAYSDRAKLAATASSDSSIRLWDLHTGKEVRKLNSSGYVNFPSVCFSPDGQRLASGFFDGGIRIWEVETGKELLRIAQPHWEQCAAFSPDGKRLATGDWLEGQVHVWDADTGKELRQYEGHRRGVNGVTFFPDGKRFATAGNDGAARIWRAPR